MAPSSLEPGEALPAAVLVIGFARTGEAVARALLGRGVTVTAVDDRPSEAARRAAAALGVDLLIAPDDTALARLVGSHGLVVVSPGVAPTHRVFALAPAGVLVSEIELAARLAPFPLVAITGTNGKTTVTTLVAAMLSASGIAAAALGNIGDPLIAAIGDPAIRCGVVEVSSFQLALSSSFHPVVATWLNFAPDHLDWHRDLAEYAAAKARIFGAQGDGDVAIGNIEDPVVAAALSTARARQVTFGAEAGDYHLAAEAFVGPGGRALASVEVMGRRLPHDKLNALAALATALEAGATPEGCVEALAASRPLPHRVELVGRVGGVEFYDDSKATTPSAVLAALAAFASLVLIAGGRNKGLDLSVLGTHLDTHPETTVRAVIAIGEASGEIEAAIAGRAPVVVATSMDEALRLAVAAAKPGDAVLLSPGCASFDWYSSYEERGRAFATAVAQLVAERGAAIEETTSR